MENKELLFARSLEAARKLAKDQGNLITTVQVKDIFATQDLSDEQYELIFDYLKKHKIGVDEAIDIDDYLSNAEKDFLADYLEGFASQREYPKDEKDELLKAAMNGDNEAGKLLAEIYLPKVAEIAKLYIDQGVFLEDLIGEGNVALTVYLTMVGCEETVEEAEAFLVRRIMDAMERLIEETARDRDIDAQMVGKVNDIAADAKELAEILGRKVTVEELAAEGKHTVEEIIEALLMTGNDGLEIA